MEEKVSEADQFEINIDEIYKRKLHFLLFRIIQKRFNILEITS